MEFIDFELPVGAIIDHGGKQLKLATMVEARIAVASEAEAPLVARWNAPNEQSKHEFRAWNGRLVGGEVGGPSDVTTTLQAEWDMSTSRSGRGRSARRRSRDRLRQHPYFAWGGEISSKDDCIMTRHASAHPALERNVRAALAGIGDSVVVAGRVWVPTTGPRIILSRSPTGTVFVSSGGPSYLGPFRDTRTHNLAPWTCLDTDSIIEALRGARGIADCRDLTSPMEVLSWDGWSREAIEQDSDEMLLDYMIESIISWRRGAGLSKASTDMLEAIVAVRDSRRNGSAITSFLTGVVAKEDLADRRDDEFADRFATVTRWLDLAHERWGTATDAAGDLSLLRANADLIASRHAALYRSLEGFAV